MKHEFGIAQGRNEPSSYLEVAQLRQTPALDETYEDELTLFFVFS